MAAAREFVYGGRGYNPRKFETKTYYRLVIQFDKEAAAIGGVDYHLCDSLA